MRPLDWEARLDAVISSRLRTPFKWGVHDCVSFAAACAQAVLGDAQAAPLVSGWFGSYADEAGAKTVLEGLGGLEVAVTARVGEPLETVLLARRGDLVMCDLPGIGPALGICRGAEGAFASLRGLAYVPLDQCTRAWRLG